MVTWTEHTLTYPAQGFRGPSSAVKLVTSDRWRWRGGKVRVMASTHAGLTVAALPPREGCLLAFPLRWLLEQELADSRLFGYRYGALFHAVPLSEKLSQ